MHLPSLLIPHYRRCNTKLRELLVIMAPSSHASRSQATTLRTVDDVFETLSIYEDTHRETSLEDARKYITDVCRDDNKLMRDTIKSLESPSVFFSVLSANSKALLKLMYKTNTVLGGIQATTFFYPIAHVTAAPWDFYCSTVGSNSDHFISMLGQITMFDKLEDIKSETGERVVYYRGNVNGTTAPVNVRIFISKRRTLEYILDLKYSYQQSIICAVGAICFWPRLAKNKQYRVFRSNAGQSLYPIGSLTGLTNVIALLKDILYPIV